MKNRYSAVIVILAMFAAGIIATGLSFQPASASTRPVVVYAAGHGWHFGSVRPYAIVIQGVAAGSGGAEVIGTWQRSLVMLTVRRTDSANTSPGLESPGGTRDTRFTGKPDP